MNPQPWKKENKSHFIVLLVPCLLAVAKNGSSRLFRGGKFIPILFVSGNLLILIPLHAVISESGGRILRILGELPVKPIKETVGR